MDTSYSFRKGDIVRNYGGRLHEVEIAHRDGTVTLRHGTNLTMQHVTSGLTLVCMKQDRCDLPGSTVVERPWAKTELLKQGTK